MSEALVKRSRGRPRKEGSSLVTKLHPMDPTITLMQGRRGPESRVWEAIFVVEGQKIGPRSLGEEEEMKAAFAAIDMKARLASKIERGEAVTTTRAQHTFGEAAKECVEELKRAYEVTLATEGRMRAFKYRAHINRINNILIPGMGEMPVRAITPEFLHQWSHGLQVRVKRVDGTPMRAPRQSTINNINHAFQKVMAVAVRKLWIAASDVRRISSAGFDDGESRPTFTHDEVLRLAEAMTPDWINGMRKRVSREMRAILRAYVAVATCVGTRPGTEMDRMYWGQLDLHARTESGYPAVVFHIRKNQGKWKKQRDAYAYQGSDAPFDVPCELAAMAKYVGVNMAPDAPMFARSDGVVPDLDGVFESLLRDTHLLLDPLSGEERSLYSLRHYFGTEAAAKGLDGMVVAAQMGTSVAMLERYYNKAGTRRHGDLLSGAVQRGKVVTEAARRRAAKDFEAEMEADEWDRDDEIMAIVGSQ